MASNCVAFPNGLKLYVVGERSGDPADWPVQCSRAYVVAYDTEEARALVRMGEGEPVAEVALAEPMVLLYEEDNGLEV
jgi:hypothetical protein